MITDSGQGVMLIPVYYQKSHGFNDETAGRGNIDKDSVLLVDIGKNFGLDITVDTDSMDYGKWYLRWVRFRRHEPVMRMVLAIEAAIASGHHVVIECYSNGWNYALQALSMVCDDYLVLAPGQKVLLIGVHPAGLTKPNVAPCVDAFIVYYTRSDAAVRAASWASWLRIVPNWGRIGSVGYRGNDPRGTSRDLTPVARGHGGAYRDANLKWFAKEKIEWIAAKLKATDETDHATEQPPGEVKV